MSTDCLHLAAAGEIDKVPGAKICYLKKSGGRAVWNVVLGLYV